MNESAERSKPLENSFYRCPRTRDALREEDNTFCSMDGNHTYLVTNGVPNFLRYESAESEADKNELKQLNELTQQIGWLKAIEQVYGKETLMFKYITDDKRGTFLDLIPLEPASEVLEIGPGLGQFTTKIAARVKRVYALEVVEEQSHFALERTKQMGMDNVEFACGGDDCTLPYGNGVFDVIVMNLVFEWCAWRCEGETHTEAQTRMLGEFQRVLKPGGILYLATKNRYALKYVIGKPDEHAYNMRFGNALPRWLFKLCLRFKGKQRPNGFLYSHGQLKRLLKQNGFGQIDSFWATPEVRYPDRYISSEQIRQARKEGGFRQGDNRSMRLLMPWIPAPLVKQVSPGHTFLARKKN